MRVSDGNIASNNHNTGQTRNESLSNPPAGFEAKIDLPADVGDTFLGTKPTKTDGEPKKPLKPTTADGGIKKPGAGTGGIKSRGKTTQPVDAGSKKPLKPNDAIKKQESPVLINGLI